VVSGFPSTILYARAIYVMRATYHALLLFLEFITMIKLGGNVFGGLAVSMLASGTQDGGFVPGRNRRIFRAKKSSACLPSEGK
jgi:hypothetical protein